MCGISGVISLDPRRQSEKEILKMVANQRHRGPDDEGIFKSNDDKIVFGHNRLSIIDLDTRSKQPMRSHDERFVITYNGEIYNYLELKEECKALGSFFKTESDSEVIVEAYRHWGENCLARFKGMWAFALYDIAEQTVLISRDFFGIKPLYFEMEGKRTMRFSSEIKALKNSSNKEIEVDNLTVELFLKYGYLDRGNWTFYKDVKRFPHCKYLKINLDEESIPLEFINYWTPFDVDYTQEYKSYEDAVDIFKQLHKKSISLHCRSDVSIGSCLSGGLDSTSIVSQASSFNKNFKCFTTQYKDYPEIDESDLAFLISKKFKTEQFFTRPGHREFKDYLNEMLEAQDEPFGSTSIFSQFMVFNLIKKHGVKVVLDGQGADEVLGGYLYITRYMLEEYLNKGMYFNWFKNMIYFSKNHNELYWKTLKGIKNRKKEFTDPKEYFLKTIKFKDSDTIEGRLDYTPNHFNTLQEHCIYLTFEGNLQQLLRYEDRNSMYFSIESRVPFLEPDLVSFILQIPTDYKFRNGFTKSILRSAYEGIVPNSILWQKNKLGFPAPEIDILKKAYNLDVNMPGSRTWREFITQKWKEINVK